MKQAPQKIIELAKSSIEPMGYELVGVQLMQRPEHGATLRIYIDQSKGITVDDCAAVSRQFSAVLDVADPLQGHYELEVSSPGLDRPLFSLAHFEQFLGAEVTVRLGQKLHDRRKFVGQIAGIEDTDVLLACENDELFRLPFELIDSARLIPVF